MHDSGPADPRVAFEAALAHHERGDLAAARRAYEALLARDPEQVPVLANLALLEMHSQRPQHAARLLERAVALAPEVPALRFNLARVLAGLGRGEEAVRTAQLAVDAAPDDVERRLRLADLCRDLGWRARAAEVLAAAVSLAPGRADLYDRLGLALGDAAREADAVAAHQRAAALAPDNAAFVNNLGNALKSVDRHDDALAAYRRAAELAPEDASVHANIGHLHLYRDALDAAVEALDAALARDPELAGARTLRARAHLRRGAAAPAMEDVRICLAKAPHDQEALSLQGLLLWRQGEKEAARQLLDLERFVHVEHLHPPPGYPDIEAFNEVLAQHVLETQALRPDPVGASTRGGRHSDDVLVRPEGVAAELRDLLRGALRRYLEALPVDRGHPFLARQPRRLRLIAQANILDSDGYLVSHIHPHAWVSGAYYVRVPASVRAEDPEHAGWLQLGHPPSDLMEPIRHAGELPVRRVRPQPGLLVLFPSYAYHGTEPFRSNQARFSLGIDVLAED